MPTSANAVLNSNGSIKVSGSNPSRLDMLENQSKGLSAESESSHEGRRNQEISAVAVESLKIKQQSLILTNTVVDDMNQTEQTAAQQDLQSLAGILSAVESQDKPLPDENLEANDQQSMSDALGMIGNGCAGSKPAAVRQVWTNLNLDHCLDSPSRKPWL